MISLIHLGNVGNAGAWDGFFQQTLPSIVGSRIMGSRLLSRMIYLDLGEGGREGQSKECESNRT